MRVLLEAGKDRHRLMLVSHGKKLEIGAFLADQERVALSRKLITLLADSRSQPHNTGSN